MVKVIAFIYCTWTNTFNIWNFVMFLLQDNVFYQSGTWDRAFCWPMLMTEKGSSSLWSMIIVRTYVVNVVLLG